LPPRVGAPLSVSGGSIHAVLVLRHLRAWREAGLHVPCKARFKLFTLDDDRIVRRLGALAPQDREGVAAALSGLIAVG